MALDDPAGPASPASLMVRRNVAFAVDAICVGDHGRSLGPCACSRAKAGDSAALNELLAGLRAPVVQTAVDRRLRIEGGGG